MKLKVIACGVLEPELLELAHQSTNEIVIEMLEAGLHDRPDLLRERVQQAIDECEGQGFDALVVGYGLCGRGSSGLIARSIPVVIPRAHDCMTLFLGSRQAYRDQFARNPGTFYITEGWYEKKVRPLGHDAEKYWESSPDVQDDPRYQRWAKEHGDDEAAYLVHFHDSWKRNYSRSAYIDTGLSENNAARRFAEHMAESLGWSFEAVAGDPHLLRKLLEGPWEDAEFLVLQPGQRSASSGDDSLLTAVDLGGGQRPAASVIDEEPQEPGTEAEAPGIIGLGIDAGGTYTDCVLYDLRQRTVLAKSKALTTHHNLSMGIAEGLQALHLADPALVKMVALSTTLATNSIVEGKGGRPGAIIMSPVSHQHSDIAWRPLRFVSGAMDIRGEQIEPVDPVEVQEAIRELLAEGVDAFAVSGYASVRHPQHELEVRELIRGLCDLPVICGHELSQRLDYLARANTAVLNARLLGLIRQLLGAVKSALAGIGVDAPLMVVKGDGSLISEAVALERPVETVLSGPAASVSGARHLTDLREGVVMDMGGTTTDSAVLSQGLVRVHPEGATVGGWRTSVEAADIYTIGLGGDSHLNFNADRELFVGPRRVLPLCKLAAEVPAVAEAFAKLDPNRLTYRGSARALDYFQLGRDHEEATLSERDQAIVTALQAGPMSRETLARKVKLIEPSLLRTEALEDLGFVQRAALTPTDLLHVTGEFVAWDATAARDALRIFAGLYGETPEQIIERVKEEIVRRLVLQVLRHVLGHDLSGQDTLAALALAPANAHPVIEVSLHYRDTIVALGAPVHPFFPQVAERLQARLIIPEHAEVANAIGAIASEVVVRERAIVRPGDVSNYVVHTRNGKREFDQLDGAVSAAREAARELAVERAGRSGATRPTVRIDVDERKGLLADGQEELIEVIVEATAAGRPVL
jgi:N-methylhydantoinase A/oxoprolinase/acetone carboxylase beta subunit